MSVKHLRVSLLAVGVAAVCLCGTARAASAKAVNLKALEARIVVLTNAERQHHGLAPLMVDESLNNAARAHSAEMLRLRYFSHQSPTPGQRTLLDRTRAAGVRAHEVGENIAKYEGYSLEEMAQRVVQDWMNSPSHRENLLYGSFSNIGVAIATDGDRIIVTQNFSTQDFAEPVDSTLAEEAR